MRQLKCGETLVGFMKRDGTILGLADGKVGHEMLAANLGVTEAARSHVIISFRISKHSDGQLNAFGSSVFPPPGDYMSEADKELVISKFE